MKDDLGDRMKQYEAPYDIVVPRRNYMMFRLDGVAFHTFTKDYETPYDETLVDIMNNTAKALCEEITGAEFAFVQSDEISIVVTDFKKINTEPWFGKRLSKILSVPASIATAEFNRQLLMSMCFPRTGFDIHMISKDALNEIKLAKFDNRIWIMSEIEEVINYFIWRQQDCTRNSISMAGQTYFSHGTPSSQLFKKSSGEIQDMLFKEKGINWNNYKTSYKRGRLIHKKYFEVILGDDKRTPISKVEISFDEFEKHKNNKKIPVRSEWFINEEIPIFTQHKEFLRDKLPKLG